MKLVPVEGNPFGPKLTPVDGNPFEVQAKDTWRDKVSAYARPALEGGGAAIGAVIGAGAGLATGPGAPAASPILGAAGGGLGYAIGKRGADSLDEVLGLRQGKDIVGTVLESAEDVATGASLEMGGQLLAPAFMAVKAGGKWAFNKAADPVSRVLTEKGARRGAGEVLQANTSAGPIYAQNAAEATEIEKQIPGLKFTAGQRTNDPNLIKLERSQMRRPGSGADLNAEQTARNNEALRTYYQNNFGGKEGIDDLVNTLQGQRANLQGVQQSAVDAVQTQAGRLPAIEPPQTGQRIVDTLKAGERTAKKSAGELYEQVPAMEIPVSNLLKDFNQISKPMSRFESPENIPDLLEIVKANYKPKVPHSHGGAPVQEGLVDQFGRALPKPPIPKVMTLDDLQGLRSELMEKAAQVKGGQTPNRRLASRYDQAAAAVGKAIDDAGEGSEALREANRFFRKDYAEVFRQGTVGQLLRPGANREATRTPLAQIPGKIWNARNLSAADDFIRATPEASNIMRDHAAYDLLQSVTDTNGAIVTAKLNAWMSRNRPLLKKFGLESDFKGIAGAQRAADAAGKSAAEFEKSVAARILNSDPERAVSAAFSGRNAGAEAAKLMQMVATDRAAKKGLQRAFADHLMDTIQTTARDVAGNPIMSNAAFQKTMAKYAPVMRELYKGEPKKLVALNTMRKAYEVATRNTRSPIGGGSDTAENIFTELGKINILHRPTTIIRGLVKIVSRHGDDKVNEMVNRALFDPDYAQTIINAARGRIPDKELQTVLDGKIIQLDAYRKARGAQAAAGAGGAIMGASRD